MQRPLPGASATVYYRLVTPRLIAMAHALGITVVAVGTSLPELATSLVAAYRGESDISVGNVVGSNIFNILLVLGLVAVIQPMQVGASPELMIDLCVMLGVSLILWPIMKVGLKIGRVEGGLMVLGYIGYTIYLFVRTAASGA